MQKLEAASEKTGIKEIAIAGGVSANSELRQKLMEKQKLGWSVHIPKFEYCTDNAAMIAMAGKFSFDNEDFSDQHISADPQITLVKKVNFHCYSRNYTILVDTKNLIHGDIAC